MHFKTVAYLLSLLLAVSAGAMTIPLAAALYYAESHSGIALLLSMGLISVIAIALRFWAGRPPETLFRREAVAVVGVGWFLIAFLAGLPFRFDGAVPSLADAFFESASGLTTTGATIMTDIESLSHAMLLWRSTSHWLGGMGIIVLFVAIFPQLGVGARRMFGAEVPGPITEGLKPKIRETSTLLWKIYFGLTLLEFILLWLAGMGPFDALNHAFATMATGGFSTKNASVGYFHSATIEWIIIFFMFLAGANFSLYAVMLKGRTRVVLRDLELRTFATIILIATAIITVNIWGRHEGFHDTLRAAMFQTMSIATTTGFGSDNFDAYPPLSKALLVTLMFIGGSAGSTAGGLKVSRVIVIAKAAWAEILRSFHPQGVIKVRLGAQAIDDALVRGILAFFGLFMLSFVGATLYMTWLGLDLVTASTAVVASLASIGPGLGKVGAIENYAFIPASGKVLLGICMILGRLEMTTGFALLSRALWAR